MKDLQANLAGHGQNPAAPLFMPVWSNAPGCLMTSAMTSARMPSGAHGMVKYNGKKVGINVDRLGPPAAPVHDRGIRSSEHRTGGLAGVQNEIRTNLALPPRGGGRSYLARATAKWRREALSLLTVHGGFPLPIRLITMLWRGDGQRWVASPGLTHTTLFMSQ